MIKLGYIINLFVVPIKGIDQKARKEFFATVGKFKNRNDFEQFFKDLMSSSEIKDLSRRYYAAKLLSQGKTYQEIEIMMGMSPVTVNKIHFKTKGSRVLPSLF